MMRVVTSGREADPVFETQSVIFHAEWWTNPMK